MIKSGTRPRPAQRVGERVQDTAGRHDEIVVRARRAETQDAEPRARQTAPIGQHCKAVVPVPGVEPRPVATGCSAPPHASCADGADFAFESSAPGLGPTRPGHPTTTRAVVDAYSAGPARRLATARLGLDLDLGLGLGLGPILARQRRTDEAAQLGVMAVDCGTLVPSNRWRADELDDALRERRRHLGVPET